MNHLYPFKNSAAKKMYVCSILIQAVVTVALYSLMHLSKYPTSWAGSEHSGANSKKVESHVEFIHSSQVGCVPDEAHRNVI